LKTGAVAIVNSLVRLYSLANQLSEPNTLQRLNSLPKNSQLSAKDCADLKHIWVFLNRLRWRHQLTHHCTDNLIQVDDLSPIEKHQLKASFKAI
jgi:CBS domain-containing protein